MPFPFTRLYTSRGPFFQAGSPFRHPCRLSAGAGLDARTASGSGPGRPAGRHRAQGAVEVAPAPRPEVEERHLAGKGDTRDDHGLVLPGEEEEVVAGLHEIHEVGPLVAVLEARAVDL